MNKENLVQFINVTNPLTWKTSSVHKTSGTYIKFDDRHRIKKAKKQANKNPIPLNKNIF